MGTRLDRQEIERIEYRLQLLADVEAETKSVSRPSHDHLSAERTDPP